jgi:CBS domain-containing protein
MGLLKIADVPAATVNLDDTVLEAVKVMEKHRVGAVVVAAEGRLRGIFTERDLMRRVVLAEKNPSTTKVRDVMTPDCASAPADMSLGEALRVMLEKHFRHLPLVDADKNVLGIVSIRNLLQHRVDDLGKRVDSLVNYMGADGPGG